MNLNEIFPDGAEFMDWLANNCYSCKKNGDGVSQNNPHCELEPMIAYSSLDQEIDENLTKIITKNGKLCKCKNFIRRTKIISGFFIIILILTGCTTNDQKVYTNKIKFHKLKTQRILYAKAKQKELPGEYYKTNFSETEIAENELNIRILKRLNECNRAFMLKAQEELKNVQALTAKLKAEISERDNQRKQLEELKKQINESNERI
jgi:hypothetical protein